ncbi:MAG: nucleoside-diphosphate kinase [Legionellales bacterium]|jgi:nucleoside-diphosphate kinase|nr:nucleoside-diphosphate kinase [Legionellales bacterium]|tara:strand:- start:129 stop:548 length:420 start_codon:yes stop_codon:yes gene_type:complete
MSTHTERTLSIIKPDAVKRDYIGNILSRFENAGMKIIAMKMMTLSKSQAETFYDIHKERPFFGELVDFISSDNVVVLVLEGKDAVQANRDIMGATNPDDAKAGTIRHDISLSISENSVHGSDSLDNANIEIEQFFPELK